MGTIINGSLEIATRVVKKNCEAISNVQALSVE
jgi:hypothetical protein